MHVLYAAHFASEINIAPSPLPRRPRPRVSSFTPPGARARTLVRARATRSRRRVGLATPHSLINQVNLPVNHNSIGTLQTRLQFLIHSIYRLTDGTHTTRKVHSTTTNTHRHDHHHYCHQPPTLHSAGVSSGFILEHTLTYPRLSNTLRNIPW